MPKRPSLVGETLAGFRIESELGAGGMGVVYRGWDAALHRNVALKVIASDERHEARERLISEAQAASALDHPNVAGVHSLQEGPGGQLCIVMPFYEGETLAVRLKRGPLAPGEALDIAQQVAAGLEAAHARGITHRDIKPSNLLITPSGTVKILDFGIAKILGSNTNLTEADTVVGTLAYMSPEQIRGERVGPQSDLWSLGIVLFESLTGRPPFEGRTNHELRECVLHGELRHYPLVPDVALPVLRKALAKHPSGRYSSAKLMREALASVAAEVAAILHSTTEHLVGLPPNGPLNSPAASVWRARPVTVAAWGTLLCSLGAVVWQQTSANTSISKAEHVTLAVLPFTAQGNQPSLIEVAEGMSESLARRISSIGFFRDRLAVVGSSELIARGAADPAEARRRLGATLLASAGLVASGGDGITLHLRLAQDGSPEPETFHLKGSLSALSQLEDRAAAEIAEVLTVRLKRAVPALQNSRPVNPEAYRSYLSGLGRLQRWDKSENLNQALQDLATATRRDAEFAAAWVGFAEAARTRYTQDKDPVHLQHAFAHVQQAIRIEPELLSAHVLLGRLYAETQQRDLAIVEYKRALDADAGDLSALVGMARTLEQMQRANEAESALNSAVQLNPYSWTAHNHLANFYYRAGRLDDAARVFRRCLELTPDNASVHSNLGGVLFAQGKLAEAATFFRSSLNLRPTYQAYTNLGNVYYRQSSFAEAARAYEDALQLVNQDFRIWGSKARALSKVAGSEGAAAGAYRRAIQLAEQSMKTVPADATTRSLLAIYHAALGQRGAAEQYAAGALAAPVDDKDALINAATAYDLIGREDRAVYWVEEALRRGYPWRDVEGDPDLRKLVASGKIKH